MTEHVPAPASRITEPDIVQTVAGAAEKLTGRPEDAVALAVGGTPTSCALLRVPNVMVCAACVTVKLWVTLRAAAKFVLPAWLAEIEHCPPPNSRIVAPDSVQTAGGDTV